MFESSEEEINSTSSNNNNIKVKRTSNKNDAKNTKRKSNHPYFAEPMIYGAFNNWQPQPLIKVSDLARALDKSSVPDFLAQCREQRKCRRDVTELS